MKLTANIFLLCVLFIAVSNTHAQIAVKKNKFLWQYGAIVRGDSTKKNIALVFTGDEYVEGLDTISYMLHSADIKGSFFFTGRLYSNAKVYRSLLLLKKNGHYLGPHSDMHLLYNDWTKRDSTLVTKDSLQSDLEFNYKQMQQLGIREKKLFFIPPYEWWNSTIATWCKELDVQLINFTPQTGTNADYTFPEMGQSYRNSEFLLKRLYALEQERGLNGAMILIHIGTDPRRTDKFYNLLPSMIDYFKKRGYHFLRVDQLLK